MGNSHRNHIVTKSSVRVVLLAAMIESVKYIHRFVIVDWELWDFLFEFSKRWAIDGKFPSLFHRVTFSDVL